jgi:DNA-binding CsgD family transcriptional regulator
MLVRIEPVSIELPPLVSVPPSLSPLIEAAKSGASLRASIEQITQEMGFASFMYGVGTGKTLHRDERYFVWSTVSPAWIAEYDQKSYVEVDPRVTHGWTALPPPLIWDRSIARGDPKVEAFLERAAAHGIGSGVAIYLHDYESKVLVALNQSQRVISDPRRAEITRLLGDAMQLASIFHLIFMKGVVAKGIAPMQQGSPLSARELQCLALAARGMTSIDIGEKLAITDRTVNFHFSNIISKLGALNRKEAIAIGMAHGLIHVDPKTAPLLPQRSSKVREAQLKRWEKLRKDRSR